jgi:hypothetical protein
VFASMGLLVAPPLLQWPSYGRSPLMMHTEHTKAINIRSSYRQVADPGFEPLVLQLLARPAVEQPQNRLVTSGDKRGGQLTGDNTNSGVRARQYSGMLARQSRTAAGPPRYPR